MIGSWHFPILVLVSFGAFIAMLRFVLRKRTERPRSATVLWVALITVVGGMTFAKTGTFFGMPVWLYYGLPAFLTWALPPLVFRMKIAEFGMYLVMAACLAPVIHILFSFFLGWKEYMPFIPVPSLMELVG